MIAKFKRDETKLDFAEAVTVTIPKKKEAMPEDYMVYMGFEMTPEELAYNRDRQRRTLKSAPCRQRSSVDNFSHRRSLEPCI